MRDSTGEAGREQSRQRNTLLGDLDVILEATVNYLKLMSVQWGLQDGFPRGELWRNWSKTRLDPFLRQKSMFT